MQVSGEMVLHTRRHGCIQTDIRPSDPLPIMRQLHALELACLVCTCRTPPPLPNTGFHPTKTKYATIGCLICWDQWFPEGARAMALRGAEVLQLESCGAVPSGEAGRSGLTCHPACRSAITTPEGVLLRAACGTRRFCSTPPPSAVSPRTRRSTRMATGAAEGRQGVCRASAHASHAEALCAWWWTVP